MLDRLKGYRTFALNMGILLWSIIDLLLQVLPMLMAEASFVQIIPQAWVPSLFALVAVANIYLRVKTNTAIGRRT